MNNEILKIFDDNKTEIGRKGRNEVHKYGYWHQVFTCIFYSLENTIPYLYLQIRNNIENAYPNILDLTVSGHILADENIEDGIREIREEIGISIGYEDLKYLGQIKYSISRPNYIDREIANIHICPFNNLLDKARINNEVSGLVKVKLDDFISLWKNQTSSINVKGYKVDIKGKKVPVNNSIGTKDFLPYPCDFYQELGKKMKKSIS